jgi:hypothetical protein
MRRVIKYTGDPEDADDTLDLNETPYSEFYSSVPHPPNLTTANNILINRLQAIANASTTQTKQVALCVLAMQRYENLFLLKEWLQLAAAPEQQFMLFIHAKNQAAVKDAVQQAQLPIDTVVLGEVETRWSSIGIVEASLLMFHNARRKGCKGAVLMSSDASPIKDPNTFHKTVIKQDGPVRGGFIVPTYKDSNGDKRKYPFAVGEQWLSFNERGLELLRTVTRDSLYDNDLLQHFEAINQHGLTKSLEYETDLRTAQIEDKYEGLAPDETLLHAILWSLLSAAEKRVAASKISWMRSDEHHALPITVDYLRKALPMYLTARKVVTHEAYEQVRRMWHF